MSQWLREADVLCSIFTGVTFCYWVFLFSWKVKLAIPILPLLLILCDCKKLDWLVLCPNNVSISVKWSTKKNRWGFPELVDLATVKVSLVQGAVISKIVWFPRLFYFIHQINRFVTSMEIPRDNSNCKASKTDGSHWNISAKQIVRWMNVEDIIAVQ